MTPVAAYGAHAAWSRFDGRRYQLMIWHDGAIEPAAIAPRRAAFDADLGLNASGRVVAVYSRCAKTLRGRANYLPSNELNEGCDLYEYDLVARRERRLASPSRRATSEFLPAIAGRRLVFARSAPAPDRKSLPPLARLVSATLGRYRERLLPRPPGFVANSRGPVTTDASAGRAVIGWEHRPKYGACRGEVKGVLPTVEAVLLYDLATRERRVLDQDCHTFRRGTSFRSPSLDGGFVFYPFAPLHPGALHATWTVRRVEIRTAATLDTAVTQEWLHASQTSAGWTWAVTQGADDAITIQRIAAPAA